MEVKYEIENRKAMFKHAQVCLHMFVERNDECIHVSKLILMSARTVESDETWKMLLTHVCHS